MRACCTPGRLPELLLVCPTGCPRPPARPLNLDVQVDLVKKVEFGMDIARGMSALHAQKPPIIHRDLKTANLLVSARLEVKVRAHARGWGMAVWCTRTHTCPSGV